MAEERYCDIVMEGGITSGVVYPLAAVKLSDVYEFRNVGGTSAGAIAAAGVAAAQYGKSNGTGTQFHELACLPKWLGANLGTLFQPSKSTKPLYRIVVATTVDAPKQWRWLGAISAALVGFPLAVILSILPAALVAGITLAIADWPWTGVAGLACSLLLLLVGLLAGVLTAIYRRVLKTLPGNGFGLVSGYAEDADPQRPPLTTWLADLFDRLAGKEGEDALTFGDLWGSSDPAERKINLEMITTCLTQTRPYRLPFKSDEFWFWPKQLRHYFPERIVNQMVEHARDDPRAGDFGELVPFPEAADLPVVVATRMSLSFPVLISAIPLYAIDHSQAQEGEDRHPEPCWFSDGGISSNFPIHFFDSAVPRWPTFAIDLRKIGEGWTISETQKDNVWMVPSNESKGDIWWNGWDKLEPLDQLSTFAGSIVKTMQTWMDTTQSQAHGYRDRVVHIDHTAKEGGMNLAMPPEVIDRLSERGKHAGEKLVQRFGEAGDGTPMTWDNQRWIRYRSFIRLLEKTLESLRKGCEEHLPPDPSIEELSLRGPGVPPLDYRWDSDEQRALALALTRVLTDLADLWDAEDEKLKPGAPEPAPELRVMPRI